MVVYVIDLFRTFITERDKMSFCPLRRKSRTRLRVYVETILAFGVWRTVSLLPRIGGRDVRRAEDGRKCRLPKLARNAFGRIRSAAGYIFRQNSVLINDTGSRRVIRRNVRLAEYFVLKR